jgi:PKD repeat protein
MINILNPTAQSYTWIYKSSITHGNSFQKTNVTSNAVVYLTANDINGCSSDRDTININIDPIKALFTATTNANVGQSVMFSNTSINATFYQWNFFDGSTSTEQSPSHIYNQTGTKNVFLKVISSLGCADSLLRSNYITILNGTGIEESKNIEFKIYPIPIKDVLNINFAEQIEKVSIEIFDSNGIKLVKTEAKGKVTINFPYPSGFYIVRIHSLSIDHVVKIIKTY